MVHRPAEGIGGVFAQRDAGYRQARVKESLNESRLGSIILFVFILSIFIPGTFNVGPLIMTPYKLILFAAFPILAIQWVFGRAGRITAPDVLFLCFCIWSAIAILINNGLGRIFFVGSLFLEYFGAYLMGRILVRSATNYRAFFRYFLYTLLILLPFVLVEFLARRALLSELMGHVLTRTYTLTDKRRLGLTRVAAGFQHPILWGVVCSIGIANAYYIFRKRAFSHVQAAAFFTFMMFTSLSSGPMFSAALQIIMIAWDRILNVIRMRWVLFVLIGVVTLAVLQLVLPGGLIGYIVNEVVFSHYAGNNRIAIFIYVTAEVLRNPLFGIGLNEWTRPFWQSSTVDNFWLVIALRYGVPAFLFLTLAIGVSALQMMARQDLDEEARRYRSGYLIALSGLILVLGTVHVWGGAAVMVMAYVGAGVWFYAEEVGDGNVRSLQERRMQTARQGRQLPERPVRGGPVRDGAAPHGSAPDRSAPGGRRPMPGRAAIRSERRALPPAGHPPGPGQGPGRPLRPGRS
jgi:hypothetical protein